MAFGVLRHGISPKIRIKSLRSKNLAFDKLTCVTEFIICTVLATFLIFRSSATLNFSKRNPFQIHRQVLLIMQSVAAKEHGATTQPSLVDLFGSLFSASLIGHLHQPKSQRLSYQQPNVPSPTLIITFIFRRLGHCKIRGMIR